ncbi:MAG: hypothetical protein Q6373_013575 [Candidatus Sigynarchaeota archaeon]
MGSNMTRAGIGLCRAAGAGIDANVGLERECPYYGPNWRLAWREICAMNHQCHRGRERHPLQANLLEKGRAGRTRARQEKQIKFPKKRYTRFFEGRGEGDVATTGLTA